MKALLEEEVKSDALWKNATEFRKWLLWQHGTADQMIRSYVDLYGDLAKDQHHYD